MSKQGSRDCGTESAAIVMSSTRIRSIIMRRTLWVLLCGATVTMVPAAASATPSSGVSGTVLGKGTSNNTIEVKNVGPTDVVVRHIVIEPGAPPGGITTRVS
jgi:hypothetical protein